VVGRQHRNLAVVADRLEGGAHGDFRFAVAHIAAQQAVHGLGDSMSCFTSAMACHLVFGLVELEGCPRTRVAIRCRREGMALAALRSA
jgi:hypothetical protein